VPRRQFSITVGQHQADPRRDQPDPRDAWKPIKYRNAVWDADEGRWVSEAEIAEIRYTAFTSNKADLQVTGRLIVRRVGA
jgi:hypothetical protein